MCRQNDDNRSRTEPLAAPPTSCRLERSSALTPTRRWDRPRPLGTRPGRSPRPSRSGSQEAHAYPQPSTIALNTQPTPRPIGSSVCLPDLLSKVGSDTRANPRATRCAGIRPRNERHSSAPERRSCSVNPPHMPDTRNDDDLASSKHSARIGHDAQIDRAIAVDATSPRNHNPESLPRHAACSVQPVTARPGRGLSSSPTGRAWPWA
jgi:hypothetical protein